MPGAPDEGVDGIPIGFAEGFESGSTRWRVRPTGRKHHAPARRRESPPAGFGIHRSCVRTLFSDIAFSASTSERIDHPHETGRCNGGGRFRYLYLEGMARGGRSAVEDL